MTALAPDVALEEKLAGLRELADAGSRASTLPSHPTLRDLLAPGLRRGSVHAFIGSTTLGIALMSGASTAGNWCATVGFPDLGIENMSSWGVDLDRLVLVPQVTAERWLDTVSALAEAIDIILACPPPTLPPSQRNRLQARLRHRGATLLVAGDWPQAASTLRVTEDRWIGLERGGGHLRGRELTITREVGHRRRSSTLHWPPPPS